MRLWSLPAGTEATLHSADDDQARGLLRSLGVMGSCRLRGLPGRESLCDPGAHARIGISRAPLSPCASCSTAESVSEHCPLAMTGVVSVGASAASRPDGLILVGNPNTGKTTLFNALCGPEPTSISGDYDRGRVGRARVSGGGGSLEVLDLPGVYDLSRGQPGGTSGDQRSRRCEGRLVRW